METRANHILIGSFVLLVMLGLFVFVIWLARVEIDREFQRYNIFFRGSVAGLGIGGDVRYRGIKIGTVSDIDIDADDPSRVKVTVEVGSENPIRQGDRARLELQGITGVSYVNIDGAVAGSPELIAEEGQELPVIPSLPSQIQRLFEGAPELVNRGILLADRVTELFDQENQQLVTGILRDVKELTASLEGRRENLERIIDAFDRSSNDVAEAAKSIREVTVKMNTFLDEASMTLAVARGSLAGADQLLTEDVGGLVDDLRDTTQSINGLVTEAHDILGDNRESLSTFSNDGLPELSRFITEARLLVASLSRVTERLESEGARFLLGDREAEFEAR
ncbi:MAG: MlaD family protein [Minwuiales bacterium]|nr:MlaD family protein [Minwuiales bacterium]